MISSNDNKDLDIQSALYLARGDNDDISSTVTDYLDHQVRMLWDRLLAEPDVYLLDKDEFALFNFFIYRYQYSPITEAAISRFWNHHQASHDGA